MSKDKQQKFLDNVEDLKNRFKKSKDDVGSQAVQIIDISARVVHIQRHLEKARKDKHAVRGLMMLLGRRIGFLRYLKRTDPAVCKILKEEIGIRGA